MKRVWTVHYEIQIEGNSDWLDDSDTLVASEDGQHAIDRVRAHEMAQKYDDMDEDGNVIKKASRTVKKFRLLGLSGDHCLTM